MLPYQPVRQLADKFAPELQNVANEFETVNNLFNQKIEDKRFAIETRNIATDSRLELANSIYSQLVRLNNLGAGIWAERNEVKYNDYIIYRGSSSTSPPENSEGDSEEEGEEMPNG